MHELSIAMSIVEMAEEESAGRNVTVSAVHLKLGSLSGVVRDALFRVTKWPAKAPPSPGRICSLRKHRSRFFATGPGRARLSSLQLFCCPECGTPSSHVIAAKSLKSPHWRYMNEY